MLLLSVCVDTAVIQLGVIKDTWHTERDRIICRELSLIIQCTIQVALNTYYGFEPIELVIVLVGFITLFRTSTKLANMQMILRNYVYRNMP